MNKRVEEIRKEIDLLEQRFELERTPIKERWRQIKVICTHPEIGIGTGMWICPDCEYNGSSYIEEQYPGGPIYEVVPSERDIENYEEIIEKERIPRRAHNARYTRHEIIKMVDEVKENLRLLDDKLNADRSLLNKEWEAIKSKCNHQNMQYQMCQDCGWSELLF